MQQRFGILICRHTLTHWSRSRKGRPDSSQTTINPEHPMTEMLKSLDWNTLQQRRKEARLGMLYRIQHDLVDIPKDNYLSLSNQSRKNTSDSRTRIRFYQERNTGRMYTNTFIPQDNCRLEWPGINSHRSGNIGCFPRAPVGTLHLYKYLFYQILQLLS